MADRFFIAPYDKNSGVQTNVKPWLIPDNAFAQLNNAYVFRGRVRKRFGSKWLDNSVLNTRLRYSNGSTNGAGSLTGTLLNPPISVGTMFSIGSVTFTVNTLGNPANLLISNGSATTATLDTTTGVFTFVGVLDISSNPVTALVYFYPCLPVMGLVTFEQGNINNEFLIAFDTQYAYQYTTGWDRLSNETTPGASKWTGSDSQFFWGTTWSSANAFQKALFVTNFNINEPNYMRSFINNVWDNFAPAIDSANFLFSAQILIVFKNRLVALNTWEGTTAGTSNNYTNRCRYAAVGSPLASNAWRADIPGNGNAIDAATAESIISAEFIKDRLIVFFEHSTWELTYTGNQAYPFTWQKINTELGAESPFSTVPFDKVVLTFGQTGIHACTGANVERIDTLIPDDVFNVHNFDSGPNRVYGIRDYEVEMVYWTFPDDDSSDDFPYPNRVLAYNYRTQTWAFNDDSITAFGYYQPTNGITWDSTTVTWNDNASWSNGVSQAKNLSIIGGNQQGFTFIVDPNENSNALSLQITDLTVSSNIVTVTCINHNLRDGDYVYINGITGTGTLTAINNAIYQVFTNDVVNAFAFVYPFSTVLTGTYAGGGLVSRVSEVSVKTKEFNFYAEQGRNAFVSRVDFMVDATPGAQYDVDFFVSTAQDPLLQEASGNGVLLGTSTLDTFPYTAAYGAEAPIPFEATATRLWRPIYFQADGEVIQLQITQNASQIMNVATMDCDFQLHAMCFFAQPSSQRFQ